MIVISVKHHLVIATLQICNLPKTLQEMTNNVGLTYCVGDPALEFTISSGVSHLCFIDIIHVLSIMKTRSRCIIRKVSTMARMRIMDDVLIWA